MEEKQFDAALFEQVFASNVERIKNSMLIAAEREAINIGSPKVTPQENRKMAVRFFAKQLAKELYNYLD